MPKILGYRIEINIIPVPITAEYEQNPPQLTEIPSIPLMTPAMPAMPPAMPSGMPATPHVMPVIAPGMSARPI